MNVATKSVLVALAVFGLGTVAHDAKANTIDDPGSGYPTEVEITSPSPTYDSQFEFTSTHSILVGGITIDADFNSDGTIAGVNSVSGIPSAADTGVTILGSAVLATLEWQGSGNSGSLNATTTGDVSLSLRFKINFTGGWLGSNTCRTGAFTVAMNNTGNTYPSPSLTGAKYSSSTGHFGIVSNGFFIPAIAGVACSAFNVGHLNSLLDVGKTSGVMGAGMKIDLGVAKYTWNGSFVSGS